MDALQTPRAEDEQQFVCFRQGGLRYLAALSQVVRVAAQRPDDIPCAELPRRAGECDGGQPAQRPAYVVLAAQEPFALLVDQVEDLVSVPAERQYEFPAQARSAANAFVCGVAWQGQDQGQDQVLFFVDPGALRSCVRELVQ